MKKTYILSCAAIIISIISMTISIIEMGTEAVTTPDGSISDDNPNAWNGVSI